jgi:dual-specificity kinase
MADESKCIHMDEYFDYRQHPCIVSELFGMSVFDFLKQNSFQPFPEKHIQDFAKSLLQSVKCKSPRGLWVDWGLGLILTVLHSLNLVHTDLKPENILLVENGSRLQGQRVSLLVTNTDCQRAGAKSKSILRNTDIRLIDFGSATFESEYHSSVVSTRHYRAPEIILGESGCGS